MPPFLLRFVLLRPRSSENLGAAARAMKNFGLRDWTWVAPYAQANEDAERLAVHAEDVLHGARVCETLAEAVADCVWVVATSSRHVPGKRRVSPRAFAETSTERLFSGPVALVFGDERSGMTNAEVERCDALSAVPTSDAQPSLNLSQAVMLYAYEAQLARLHAAPRAPGHLPSPATHANLARLRDALESHFEDTGFLHQKGRSAEQDLISPFRRAQLTRKEYELWMAALRGGKPPAP